MTKWDKRFLNLANLVSSWSKDPSTQVGCVLVDGDRHVIATGYNGFPRGVYDDVDRYENRKIKYQLVQHAEANAIMQAVAPTKGATAYVTHMPCSNCAGMLIQAGVKRIVTTKPEPELQKRFDESFGWSMIMFVEACVKVDFLE